jgi:branched-chain amino acid transport system permease protein
MTALSAPQVVRSTRASRAGAVVAVVLLIVLVSTPWWSERSDMRTITEFLYPLALAELWNLIAGFGGLVSIGQQGFIGIGGYMLVLLAMKLGVDPFLAIPICGVVAAIIAVPTALLVFRLRGAYFAVGTWVVAEVFRLSFANIIWLGAGTGTSLTSAMTGYGAWIRDATTLWIAVAIGLGSVALVYLLLRSRIGLALIAIRDSEVASQSLGVGVRRVKLIVYVVSAFGCGMVGALVYVTKLRISPDAAFDINWTVVMIFTVVIGGIGTIEGPIFGALVFQGMRSEFADFGSYYLMGLGALAIAVMLFFPAGLWGALSERFGWRLFPTRRRLITRDGSSAP